MLKNYFKTAFKVLWRHKLFTFISLFGISFTLLILIVITSFVDHTFGPVTPEKKLDRTLSVTMSILKSKSGGMAAGPLFSPYFLKRYVKSLITPELISLSSFHNPIITYKNNRKFNFALKFVDGEFWQILDFEFLEGQGFSTEDVEMRNPVAVISKETRDKYFEGEPALGKTIKADGQNFRVIGIVENVSLLRIMPYSDIWVPLTYTKDDLNKICIMGGFPGWYAMILARDKSDLPIIQREFNKHLLEVEFPEGRWVSVNTGANTYAEAITRSLFRQEGDTKSPLLIFIFVLMFLFMLLPTVNLVNINISRILERSSEIGVRKAFGASSITLIWQFITENVIITLIGGAISLFLAILVLMIINDSGMIPHLHLTLNYRVFMVSLVICLCFGLLSGVYPAYKMSRLNPVDALRGGRQ